MSVENLYYAYDILSSYFSVAIILNEKWYIVPGKVHSVVPNVIDCLPAVLAGGATCSSYSHFSCEDLLGAQFQLWHHSLSWECVWRLLSGYFAGFWKTCFLVGSQVTFHLRLEVLFPHGWESIQ